MRNTGILYFGENALEIANNTAAKMLGTTTENLGSCPDYLFIGLGDDSSIGVEKAGLIIDKSSLQASVAEQQVCVVDHMEKMTIPAQNKLLKTLEESALIVLGVCYEDTILPTVKSRMQIVNVSDKQSVPVEVSDVAKNVRSVIKSSDRKELFSILGLVREKDPNSFYSLYKPYMGYLLTEIGSEVCSSKHSEKVMDMLISHRERCMSSDYTQNDLFVLIANIIEN